MNTYIRSLAVSSFAVLLGACSSMYGSAPAAPARVADGVFVNDKGMTLYVFDKDAANSGKSVCTGQCAKNWPPFSATDGAMASGEWSVITRDDGTKQWAWKGKPLYAWVKDQKPGDKTGEGMANNSWHVAKP